MRDAPKGVHLKNRLSSITQGLIERSALFSFHPPTSVRLPLRFRVLASQKATSVPYQSEKDYQSFSAVVPQSYGDDYSNFSAQEVNRFTPSSPNRERERMACSRVFSVVSLVLEKNLSA